MSRSARLLMLTALSLGVLLVGVELMVTAVALPAIVADLADWTELRRASWIVNGYLLAYVAVMPLAGRAADRYPLPVLFAASLALFAAGSLLAGAAQDLDWLVGARLAQGLGAGAIVPLATAGASHLFAGAARARAIGTVSALTFLGMAAGPFIGALVLDHLDAVGEGLLGGVLSPGWRWIFYLGAPFGLLAGVYVWAAAPGWPPPRTGQRLDVAGAGLFTVALGAGVLALTALGSEPPPSTPGALGFAIVAVASGTLAGVRFSRASHPFIDLRHFRNRTFTGAVALSLLTGYALATAIIGGAVFVDRVRYAGAAEQQLALGALAGAVALGALAAGVVLRRIGVVALGLSGLAISVGGLLLLAQATAGTGLDALAGGLALFGLGFGLTVTARSTAAVEALGQAAYGLAAASVTVARMIGMAVGLAALTVLGSNRIEALSVVLVDQAARDAVLPEHLRGRPLQDFLVVDALEAWAAGQAAEILAGLFLVAAVVTALAIVPTLAMRESPDAALGSGDDEVAADGAEDRAPAGVAI